MENWTEKIKKILKEIRNQRRWRVVLTTMAGAVVFVTTYALILPGITLEEEVALEDPGIFLEGDFAEDAFAEDTFAEDAEAGLPADGEDGFFLSDDVLFAEDQELDGFADADLSGGLDTLEDYEEYDGSADADGLSLDADAAGLDDGIMADGFLIEDGEDLALTDELSTDHFRIRMDEDAMVPEGTAISVKEVKDTQSYQEIAAQLLGADVSAIQVYEIRLKKDGQEILPMADVTVETTLEAARNADAVLAFDDPAYAKQAAIVEQDDKLVFETDEITYIAFCSMSGAQDVEGLAEILPDAMEEAGWEAEALEAGEDTLEDTAVEDALVEEVIEEAADDSLIEDIPIEDTTVIEEAADPAELIEADETITDEPILEEAIPEITEVPAEDEEPGDEETEAEEIPIIEGLAIVLAGEDAAETVEAENTEETSAEAPAEEMPIEALAEEMMTEAPAEEGESEAEPATRSEELLPVGVAMELYMDGFDGTIGAVEIETEAETEAVPSEEETTEDDLEEADQEMETEEIPTEEMTGEIEDTEETLTEEPTEASEESLFEEETEEATEAATEENLIEEETEVQSIKTLTAKEDTYEIVVSYNDDAGIPEGAQLEVTEILQKQDGESETEGADYEACLEKSREYIDEGSAITYARFFSIRILYEGEEITPEAPVTVNIYLTDVKDDVELNTVHLTEDSAEIIGTNTQEGISFETSGF